MFCTAADVLDGPLKTMDLSKVGDRTAQEAWIESLIPAAEELIRGTTHRDFLLHEDDVIVLNGRGTDTITVWRDDATLCVPILVLNSLSVYGNVVSSAYIKVDAIQGIIGLQRGNKDPVRMQRMQRKGWYDTFPNDFQNVSVNLDWGYATVPEIVKLATAYIVAGLSMLALSGGISGGVRAKRIEDFSVEYGVAGPYAPQIAAWNMSAMMMLESYRTGRKNG